MEISLNVPINSVSLGQTSICLLRELFSRPELNVNVFPIGQTDISAQKPDLNFSKILQERINRSILNHNKNIPVFKLWHIISSCESVISKFNSLFTFHETSSITDYEKNVLNCQDLIFVSSDYTKSVFEAGGVKAKIVSAPLGFDSWNFSKLNKKFYNDGRIVWGLIGKAEKRKATFEIIKLWVKKYGNNKNHILHLLIDNHFVNQNYKDPAATQKMLQQALEGKNYSNIVWLNSLQENSAVNDLQNSIDIDLSGLSLTEGWGIPFFTSLCLGKWGIALNAHSNKMFCNSENSILVEPNGMTPAEDGMFFIKGNIQNIGEWFSWDENEVINAMEKVELKAKTPNQAGEELKDKFSWKKTVDIILGN